MPLGPGHLQQGNVYDANSGISGPLYDATMKNIIQFLVTRQDGVFTATGANVPVVTDGESFEVLIDNLKEAVALYFEDEDPVELGFGSSPSILTSFELTSDLHYAEP